MRIVFLTHNIHTDNGAGVFSRRLISAVRADVGSHVRVLTTVRTGEDYEEAILYPNKWRLFRALPRIRRTLKNADIIHALDAFPYGIIAVFASLGLRKKIIITATGSGSILPLYHWLYSWPVRYAYARANTVTAISSFTRDEILKKIPNLKIRVINHGVDADFFAKPYGAYDTAGLKDYILGVGTIRWRKGYHFSIRAFAKIATAFPHLNYVIVGKRYKHDYDERLTKLIKELQLEGRVIILDGIENCEALSDIYQGAELFCLFSQNVNHDVEGFGLVFLEAAAAGLPVVGSKNCGIDDAVRDGENSILVPTRDPDDFAAALQKILANQELRQKMSDASRAFARASSWEKRIGEYQELYRCLDK
ncbi:MAG: glycosyltransferase family 4 protein [bacterium]|nr:glycosyltransferase family 4 protein [bacterium]